MLLFEDERIVKTRKFGESAYIGDPLNTTLIFNELEVHELMLIDIAATRTGMGPNLDLISRLVNYCFMPIAVGGGIRSAQDAASLFNLGVEKVVINDALFRDPKLLRQVADIHGRQAVVAAIDYKLNDQGIPEVWSYFHSRLTGGDPKRIANQYQSAGAGEILLTYVDGDGSWSGVDLETADAVASTLDIPLIYNGGVSGVGDVRQFVEGNHVAALGIGSALVYQKKDWGVLVGMDEEIRRISKMLSSP